MTSGTGDRVLTRTRSGHTDHHRKCHSIRADLARLPGWRLIGPDRLICAARRGESGSHGVETSGPRFNFRHTNADPIGSPVSEPLMMSSQLGRIILGSSASSADEMSAQPDQDGRYGPLDELLEEIVAQTGSESEVGDDRRPGLSRPPGQLSADRPRPVSQPSG